MTRLKHNNINLESFVDGTTGTNLLFLMKTLHRIGDSLKWDRSTNPSICIVTHDEYQTICPNKLNRKALKLYHNIMKYGDNKSREILMPINNDLMDFAAWEIIKERVSVFEWDHEDYDLQIIEGLHEAGLSLYETMKRDPHERLDARVEIPIILQKNHEYSSNEFINLNGLVNGAVKYRDAVLSSDMVNEKKKFEDADHEDKYISVGQYLFNEGLVEVRLYRQ